LDYLTLKMKALQFSPKDTSHSRKLESPVQVVLVVETASLNSTYSRQQYTDMHIGCVRTGKYYWKVAADGPLSDYPKLISDRWPGLPDNVDAAAAHPGGTVFFFKGNKTWSYAGSSLLQGSPRLISDVWEGMPSNVDAAMFYTRFILYFFRGKSVHSVHLSQCWHLNQLV
jgi:hypothetical protein